MMKKIMALMLSVMMLCGAAAFAETAEKQLMATVSMNGTFDLRCRVPDGYTLEEVTKEEMVQVWELKPEDAERPEMVISVGFDEMHAEIDRLNDLTDAEKAAIEATWKEEYETEVSYMETALGTQLMVVREIEDGVDFVDFYTIYKGHDIEFVLLNADKDPLTDEEIAKAVQFLSDLDFVPVEEAK